MSRLLHKVSVAIRILQRDRDVSARASHLAKRVISLQAEMGKFLISTVLERNIMSTKTTFKRVALVVAAAVSFGGVSAVASHATTGVAATPFFVSSSEYSATASGASAAATETALQVAGVGSYVEITTGDVGFTNATVASAALVTVSGAGATFATPSADWVLASSTSALSVGNLGTGKVLRVYTPTAGTVVINVYPFASGSAGTTAAQTITVTVEAAASYGVYSAAKSTVYADSDAVLVTPTSTTDAAYAVTADSAGTAAVAQFQINQLDANGYAVPNGSAKAVAVYTTGGTLSITTATTGYAGSYITDASHAVTNIWIAPNGVVGNATVTITIGGVVAKTYAVTFTSSTPKTLTLTAVNTNIATAASAASVATPLGTLAATPAFVVTAKDVNGNVIKSDIHTALTATSSDTTIAATPTISGTYNSTLGGFPVYTTGALAGTVTVKVASAADSTITSSGSLNVVDAGIATLALSLDNTSYGPGDLVTVTLTAANAAGNVVADGTYADVLDSTDLVSNQSLPNQTGALKFVAATHNAKFVNGVATTTFYAPGSSFALKAAAGAGAAIASALAGTALTASATVVNAAVDAANAAADAAAEATDAANAATDAATNAMDSADAAQQAAMDAGDKADAALTAITDLASKVQSFITSISAQISALSAAVAKIKSKVKA